MKSHALLTYTQGRERVLGGLWVHRDPTLAADMLADKLGGRDLALDWLADVAEMLEHLPVTAVETGLEEEWNRAQGRPAPEPPDDYQAEEGEGLSPQALILRSQLLTASEVANMPPPEWLLDGILTKNSLAAVYGKKSAGKTFVALDWALSLATGAWWFGRKVTKCDVFYICAEGSAGLGIRQRAWEKARNVIVDDDCIRYLPRAVNLLSGEWTSGLTEMLADIWEVHRPTVVFVDTVSRSMAGGDENGSKDMTRFVESCERIKAARPNTTVVVVHHQPHDAENMRGHTSLEGAMDSMVEVKADDVVTKLTVTKLKDAESGEVILLNRRPVGESCAMYCHDGRGSSDPQTATETAVMEAAWQSSGSNGLAVGVLIRIAEVPERSGYRAVKTLLTRGALVNVGTDKQPRYTPAEGSHP